MLGYTLQTSYVECGLCYKKLPASEAHATWHPGEQFARFGDEGVVAGLGFWCGKCFGGDEVPAEGCVTPGHVH